jgi:hypothetical protein
VSLRQSEPRWARKFTRLRTFEERDGPPREFFSPIVFQLRSIAEGADNASFLPELACRMLLRY